MSQRWLVVRLEAPIVAYGSVVIDHVGPTHFFPSASMLTGLFANALGWHWSDKELHQELQDRLVFAVRTTLTPLLLTDAQNAQLSRTDKAWTTFGEPERRAGGSHRAPHRRFRDYIADHIATAVVRLEPPGNQPVLKRLATALDTPARPLYIGRKSCLPSCRMVGGWISADNAHDALCALPGSGEYRAMWPVGEGPDAGSRIGRIVEINDIRNWRTGLHGGSRHVIEGQISSAGQI